MVSSDDRIGHSIITVKHFPSILRCLLLKIINAAM